MSIKQYLKKHGVKLALIVIAAALIVGVSTYMLSGRAGMLANVINGVVSPIRSATSAVAGWLEGVYGYLYEYDRLKTENGQLRLELEKAREQLRDAASANDENERLRELLNLSERHSDFVFEAARIVSWGSSNWSSSFTISKGEESGIELGDCVVTEAGALVGQVIELGSGFATVRTVVDVDINIGALVGEAGNAAMIIGDFSLMQKGYTKLTYLTEGAQPLTGGAVLTSGKGSHFPQGLIIGYITEVLTEAGGQMPYAVVEPACDLGSLVQVFIIKDFSVME